MFINKKFILASSSKSRYKILKKNNLNFFKKKPTCNEELIKKKLINYGFSKIDYLEIYNENNLSKKNIKKNNLRVFVAACIGKTRLIDNYKN